MKTVTTVDDLRANISRWRSQGLKIAFVPTMGNLHEGHLSLVRQAKKLADKVVVSIFVNPLQFGENEDFGAYPRVLEADSQKLQEEQIDLLFAPSVEEMYPDGRAQVTQVVVPMVTDMLCGTSRPGHFAGVATVVSKLFNMVQPDVALFGEKDYQQVMVIRKMVADLCMPVEIVPVPTQRAADGLALSSRNGYLSAEQRQIAPRLYQTLLWVKQQLEQGRSDFSEICQQANRRLQQAGFIPDYLEIRRAADLQPASADDQSLVILAAARLGKARLIDNLRFPL